MDRLLCHLVSMLFSAAVLPLMKTALQELGYQDYVNSLHKGKTSLLYFNHGVSSNFDFFLEELNKSVEPLQDYGVGVAKVNCVEKEGPKYCGHENVYLFRGDLLLRQFPKDILFDVNAIVANVLFTLLFNEVKHITLFEEFLKAENDMKGQRDLVFTYVRATGVPEHRAVMEAAFVYGAKYQFVLTTEYTVLSEFGVEDPDKFHAVLFFCHCKVVKDLVEPCKRTTLEQQSLTTLNIHKYLKLMDAPLVTVVDQDPAHVSTIHLQLGYPMIFIIGQKSTHDVDRATAEHIAWNLMGKAGIGILFRDIPNIKIPTAANVAFKRRNEDAIQFLVLEDIEDVSDLVGATVNEEHIKTFEVMDDDQIEFDQEAQDDQVAEAVYRDRKRKLPLELLLPLTEKTFQDTVTRNRYTVVLFYIQWDAVSVAFLSSYTEVAIKLKETSDILMSMINCGDWPEICNKENVTCLPHTQIYYQKGNPLTYNGMLGTEALYRFIILSMNYNASPGMSPPLESLNNKLPPVKKSAADLDPLIGDGILEWIPEITVENLPSYIRLRKPLLILFCDDNPRHSDLIEMSNLWKAKQLVTFSTGWLNLKNTPVGIGILKEYFSSFPDLPVLILVDPYTNGYVFVFPSDQTFNEENLFNWLDGINKGTGTPISLLSNKEWTPPLPHYDFLAMMDATMPNLASQKIPIHFSSNGPPTDAKDQNEKTKWNEMGKKHKLSSRIGVMETSAKFRRQHRKSKHRLEL
ncbi:thioredoxin domain-containing protein 16 [Ambystoma mexicanum]|uniref:thioredoxin domain-containing protein 16 n=1 Tax=Ambystoma mexicanum TaxID=8296 RepID=UPI0037E9120C